MIECSRALSMSLYFAHGRWWCDFQRKIIPCNATCAHWHNSSVQCKKEILSIDINLTLVLLPFFPPGVWCVCELNISQMYLCNSRNRPEIEILYSSHRLTLVFRRNSTWKDVKEISLIFSTLKSKKKEIYIKIWLKELRKNKF